MSIDQWAERNTQRRGINKLAVVIIVVAGTILGAFLYEARNSGEQKVNETQGAPTTENAAR